VEPPTGPNTKGRLHALPEIIRLGRLRTYDVSPLVYGPHLPANNRLGWNIIFYGHD